MAFCTECGAKLPENAQFCTSCGTKQHSFAQDESCAETCEASSPEASVMETEAEASPPTVQETHYYTPPAKQGFIPPYQPGKYGFSPPPQASCAPPKKSGGKTALIVIICIVALAVGMIFLFSYCGSRSGISDYLGYWESEEIDFGTGSFADEYYGKEVKAMLGLQINSNGSMYLGSIYNSEIIDGRWTENAGGISASLNGQPVYISLHDGKLILQDGSMAIAFERAGGDINSPSIPFGSYSGSGSLPELPSAQQTAPPAGGSAVSGSGDVAGGLYHIAVVGAEKSSDLDGKPVIRFYYEFTNHSEYSVYAWDVLDFEVMQDGSALDATYTWDDNVPEYYNNVLSIRPGVTILCISEYNMNPDAGSIDFTVFGWDSGKNSGSVTASFTPSSLPGRPAQYQISPVESPAWTLSVPASGTLDGVYYVEVKTASLVTDNEGNDAIRVYYSFTNNSSSPASLASALFCISYQDGVQLDESYASDSPQTDNMAYTNIRPGETADCSIVFELRSATSPVEAEIEAGTTYDAVGQTFPLS